eukprot:TRINITY_DN6652_c0_g1_i1.p1 TRINITY_DN6652_c0_g1~~TRINITY_DN6652_c0_g1_i1.p1  ORF type:complete len:483 (-),score=107.14 TRINITY_DN6652_c0_g1_i1:55-1503(-)
MIITANHPNVDAKGVCYLPVLSSWNTYSNLITLLVALQQSFTKMPPVRAKPVGAPTATSTFGNSSYSAATTPPPYSSAIGSPSPSSYPGSPQLPQSGYGNTSNKPENPYGPTSGFGNSYSSFGNPSSGSSAFPLVSTGASPPSQQTKNLAFPGEPSAFNHGPSAFGSPAATPGFNSPTVSGYSTPAGSGYPSSTGNPAFPVSAANSGFPASSGNSGFTTSGSSGYGYPAAPVTSGFGATSPPVYRTPPTYGNGVNASSSPYPISASPPTLGNSVFGSTSFGFGNQASSGTTHNPYESYGNQTWLKTEQQKLEEEEARLEEAKRKNSQLQLKQKVQEQFLMLKAEVDSLEAFQTVYETNIMLVEERKKLEQEKQKYSHMLNNANTNLENINRWFEVHGAEFGGDEEGSQIETVLRMSEPPGASQKQELQLRASIMAHDDLLLELEMALKKGLLTLPDFLRITRDITSEQFKSKALVKKIVSIP